MESLTGTAVFSLCSVLVVASGDGTLDSRLDDAWLSERPRTVVC